MSIIDKGVIGLCEFVGQIPIPFIADPLRNLVASVAAKYMDFDERDTYSQRVFQEREGQGTSLNSLPTLLPENIERKGEFGLKKLSGTICHLPSKEGNALINESVFVNLGSFTAVTRRDFEKSKESLAIDVDIPLEQEAIVYNCPKTAKVKCIVLDGEYRVGAFHVKSYRNLCPEDSELGSLDVYRRKVIDDVTLYANNFIVKFIAEKIPLKFHPTVLVSRLFLFLAEKTNKPKLARLCQRIFDIVIKVFVKIAAAFAVFALSAILAPIVAIALGVITGVSLLFGGIIARQEEKGEDTFVQAIMTSVSERKFTEIFTHVKNHGDLKGYGTTAIGLLAIPILLTAGLSTLLTLGSVAYGLLAVPYSIYKDGKAAVLEFKS